MEDAVSKGGKVTIGGKKPDLPEPYNKVMFTRVSVPCSCPPATLGDHVRCSCHDRSLRVLDCCCQ